LELLENVLDYQNARLVELPVSNAGRDAGKEPKPEGSQVHLKEGCNVIEKDVKHMKQSRKA
jgi:hypothetical protein